MVIASRTRQVRRAVRRADMDKNALIVRRKAGDSNTASQGSVLLHGQDNKRSDGIRSWLFGSITNCMGNRVFLNGAGLTAHGEGRPSLIANDFSLFKPKCIKN